MGDIVYKAVYSDDHLAHFKYIDKWKSKKTGKWVYKYLKDASDDVSQLKSQLEDKKKNLLDYIHKEKPKPTPFRKKDSDSKNSGWHDVGKDAALSEKTKYEESLKGNNLTRIRKVKDSSGKEHYRREYQDSAEQLDVSRKVHQHNDARKSSAGVFKFLMDFNDKYGPKYISQTHGRTGDGENFVMEYRTNLFGGRAIDVETYRYYETERKKRRKRWNRRDAIKK